MIFSVKRMNAIFQKDLKDLSKNIYVITALFTPIIMAIMLGNSKDTPIELHYLIINMTLVMVGSFVQSAVIAEEKEKHTLRGLMLSPATLPEILAGKSLVSFILTLITVILCSVITGYQPENIILIGIAIVISTFFYLAIGTLIGLLTRTVIEASVVIVPVFFIFGLGPILLQIVEKYPILTFVKYFPSMQLNDIAEKVQDGLGIMDVGLEFGITIAWLIVSVILTVFVFKKREMDE